MTDVARGRTLVPKLSSLSRFTFVDVVLWALRIGVVMVVVGGSVGTLIKGRYGAVQWFEFLTFGVTMGSVYALVALGYTMVYGVLRLINFAHGDIMMTGAFAGYFVATGFDRSGFLALNPLAAILITMVVSVVVSTTIALIVERIAYRPFRHVRGFAPLISAIGASFFLEQTFRGLFGSSVKSYPDLHWQHAEINVLGFLVPKIDLMVIAAAVLSMAVLYAIVNHTKMGTAIRA